MYKRILYSTEDKGSPLRETTARNRNHNRNDHESWGGGDFNINIPAARSCEDSYR